MRMSVSISRVRSLSSIIILSNHHSSIIAMNTQIYSRTSIMDHQPSIINHQLSIGNHHQPITNHQSSITNNLSSPITNQSKAITNHHQPITNPSPIPTNHQAPIINHQAPITNHYLQHHGDECLHFENLRALLHHHVVVLEAELHQSTPDEGSVSARHRDDPRLQKTANSVSKQFVVQRKNIVVLVRKKNKKTKKQKKQMFQSKKI